MREEISLHVFGKKIRGNVEDTARRLIDAARATPWLRVRMDRAALAPAWDLLVGGSGAFRWDRTIDGGLREEAASDGARMVHIYRDLGVGAERRVSRHHERMLDDAAPWLIASADELARGADVHRSEALPVLGAALLGLNIIKYVASINRLL